MPLGNRKFGPGHTKRHEPQSYWRIASAEDSGRFRLHLAELVNRLSKVGSRFTDRRLIRERGNSPPFYKQVTIRRLRGDNYEAWPPLSWATSRMACNTSQETYRAYDTSQEIAL